MGYPLSAVRFCMDLRTTESGKRIAGSHIRPARSVGFRRGLPCSLGEKDKTSGEASRAEGVVSDPRLFMTLVTNL